MNKKTMVLVVSILLTAVWGFISTLSGDVQASGNGMPDLGPNVYIFGPENSFKTVQRTVDDIFYKQESSQFGTGRYAILFKPGEYEVDVNVGFYTEVLGLGRTPDEVHISGAVRSEADWMGGNATCTFWRACAGLSVTPTYRDATTRLGTSRWAVSQAAPMRRMHIMGNLILADGGWSSGGFIADTRIDGMVDPSSQQQWLSRNSFWMQWKVNEGSWNYVFMGIENPPKGEWPLVPHTVVERTPLIREKPFLVMEEEGILSVLVPEMREKDSLGTSWKDGTIKGKTIPIEDFFIMRPDQSDPEQINEALEKGKNLLITPGIYRLKEPLRIVNPGTVVLGIGYPTLIPLNGQAAVIIADVDGISAGGFMIDAGPVKSPALMLVGEKRSDIRHDKDPVFLYDIFCRAGGMAMGKAGSMLIINSHDVVGDHFWLWRADHGHGVGWEQNQNENALIVNGDHVTVYGLFAEHTQEYQTIWNGNYGRTVMYQSEFPYDPPNQEAWQHNGLNGYASYKVGPRVTHHQASGLGCYAVFNNSTIDCSTAIEVPMGEGIEMKNMVTLWLRGGSLSRVVNDKGEKLTEFGSSRILSYP